MAVDTSDSLREWDFLGQRVLMAGRFPPVEDGIARYADQLARALEGRHEIVRIGQGGDLPIWLRGGLRPLWLARVGRRFDDVLVMYHPVYFIKGGPLGRLVSYAALFAATRLRRTTFVIHERDEELVDERVTDPLRSEGIAFRIEEWLRQRLWARRVTLVFHTEWERSHFGARFHARGRTEHVVDHGSFFIPSVDVTRDEARRRLGLARDRPILLCIGFISPHKNYEQVIGALDGQPDAELHIVGDRICDYPDVLAYMDELRALSEAKPNVALHEGYVSDEDFDLWLRAADRVVVPYRAASSSSVIVRAHLLGTPVITTGAGGLADQLAPGDMVYGSDEELVGIIRNLPAARVRTDA